MEYLVSTSLSSEAGARIDGAPDAASTSSSRCAPRRRGARPRPRRRAPRPQERQHLAHDARRPEEDLVQILDFEARAPRDGPSPRPQRLPSAGTPEYMWLGAGARRRGDAAEETISTRWGPLLRDAHRPAPLPGKRRSRDDTSRCMRTAIAPRPSVDQARRAARGRVDRSAASSRKTVTESAFRTRTISRKSSRRCNAVCRARRGTSPRATTRHPRPPPPQSPGVIEWASRRRRPCSRGWRRARIPPGNAPTRTCTRRRHRNRGSQASLARSRLEGEDGEPRAASSKRSRGRGRYAPAPRSSRRSKSSRTKSRARCAICPPRTAEVARLREGLQQGEKVVAQAKPKRPIRPAAPPGAATHDLRAPSRRRAGDDPGPSASSSRSTRAEGPPQGGAGARPPASDRGAARTAFPATPEALEEDLANGREKVAEGRARASGTKGSFRRCPSTLLAEPPEGQARGARSAARAYCRPCTNPDGEQHAGTQRQPRADLIRGEGRPDQQR